MVDVCRAVIVGDSLFAETLSQMLAASGKVVVVGTAPTPEEALPLLEAKLPDAVIVVDADEFSLLSFIPLLIADPHLPLIRADLNTNQVLIITSRQINARRDDLLNAILSLPRQGAEQASQPARVVEGAQ
jgi:chemotaxis response regulator CheB